MTLPSIRQTLTICCDILKGRDVVKAIKTIARNIRDEQCDARKYAKLALEYAGTDRALGDMYHELARQEQEHASIQHEQAMRLIGDFKRGGKEVPEAMQAVWDWEHEHMIEEEMEISKMLDMYK